MVAVLCASALPVLSVTPDPSFNTGPAVKGGPLFFK